MKFLRVIDEDAKRYKKPKKYRIKNNANNNLPNTMKNNENRIKKQKEEGTFDELHHYFNKLKIRKK